MFFLKHISKLCKRRHRHATVFVDHCSRLSYVHVHETANADDAIAAKRAFEQHARKRGVTIEHCHADNGIFKSAAFLQEVTRCQKTGRNGNPKGGKKTIFSSSSKTSNVEVSMFPTGEGKQRDSSTLVEHQNFVRCYDECRSEQHGTLACRSLISLSNNCD